MRLALLKYEGYKLAILGAMLSKGKVDFDTLLNASIGKVSEYLEDRSKKLAPVLAGADGGHNKFLEQIQYWILINAPLYFWKQFDTYRIGVSKSSESTMFKMWKNGVKKEDFENPNFIYSETLQLLNKEIKEYNANPSPEKFMSIISNLPDGFLQTRILNINAKALRNIYFQRRTHKLSEWRKTCKFIEGLPYAHLITAGKERE